MIKDAPQDRVFTVWRVACAFVLVLSGAAYLPAISGLAIWDDHALIGGSGIGGGKSLSACFTEPFLLHYFRPLVSVSFFVDHKLFGSGPFFYHQTNILIHVATTFLCLLLFRAAFKSRTIALAGALLFAVQPSQISTVAWIGGRTDSLCTLWLTLFAWALVRSAQTTGRIRNGWTLLGTVAFALAMLTKEQALAMLLLAPPAYVCFSDAQAKDAWRLGLRSAIPYALAGCAFIATWCIFYPAPHQPVVHGFVEQAALAGRTLTYYTGLLALPTPSTLHMLSVGTLERWGIWSVIPGYASLIAIIGAGIVNRRSNPPIAWFALFITMGVLPVSNLIPLPSLVVAPYRVGVCGPAAAALLGWLFVHGCSQAVATLQRMRAMTESSVDRPRATNASTAATLLRAVAGVAMLGWYIGLSWWGSTQWDNERTLFAAIVRYDPDSIVGRFNLTTAMLKQHQSRLALNELDQLMTHLFGSRAWLDRTEAQAALRNTPAILVRIRENQGNAIRPDSWLAALYGQRGFALMDSGDRAAARRSFDIGMAIDRTNDDVNLGIAQLAYDGGNYKSAACYLRVALAARPRRPEAHMLLGHAYAAQGRWSDAKNELEAWAGLQPWSGQAQMEVAQAHCRLGDYAAAQARLNFALRNSICDVQEVRARLRDLHGRAAQFLN